MHRRAIGRVRQHSLTDYTGLPFERLLAWKWMLSVHQDDVERIRIARDLAAQTRTPIRFDLRLRRFDGHYRWHFASDRAFVGDDGEISRWVGAAVDIEDAHGAEADHRHAQREVEDALAFLEDLQAKSPVGLSLLDRDFRFLRINEELAAANALPVGEHIGRRVTDVLPELWPRIEPYYHQVLETGNAVRGVEVTIPSGGPFGEDGKSLESYYPVVSHGAIVAVGAVVLHHRRVEDSSSPDSVNA